MYLFTGRPDISNEPPPMAGQPSESPLLAEAGRPATPGLFWRPVGYTALAVGAAAAIAGVITFAAAPAIHKDADGNVLLEDAGRFRSSQTQQGLGVGLMVGGAVIAAAGGAVLLAPSSGSTVKASVWPTAGGAVVTLGGTY